MCVGAFYLFRVVSVCMVYGCPIYVYVGVVCCMFVKACLELNVCPRAFVRVQRMCIK